MTDSKTIGDALRSARRGRRVTIESAAEETRIRAAFLMRMESDEFDFLAPAYVRGFLKSYCRWLGIAPQPLLEDFDRRYGTGRADTGQIAALERRGRHVPRQRQRPSSWTVATVLAALCLVALAVVGIVSAPTHNPGASVAGGAARSPGTGGNAPPSPTPHAGHRTSPRKNALALNDGIDLEVVAARAPCWVTVTADGTKVYTSSPALAVGGRAGPFHAKNNMDIVLGNAYGVDLVVNGKRLGPLGSSGQVLAINLPDDIKSLL